jgi:hypothetical protein
MARPLECHSQSPRLTDKHRKGSGALSGCILSCSSGSCEQMQLVCIIKRADTGLSSLDMSVYTESAIPQCGLQTLQYVANAHNHAPR